MHALLYHMIDVAETAGALWDQALSPAIRRELASVLNLSEPACRALTVFLAGAHDIGKASPAFQRLCKSMISRLEALGFDFPKLHGGSPARHDAISACVLRERLPESLGLSKPDARDLAAVIGGHHGAWITPRQVQHVSTRDLGGEVWEDVRRELLSTLAGLYGPPASVALPTELARRHAVLTVLAGLVTAADWLGSMDTYFRWESEFLQPRTYAERAARTAGRVLKETGWLGWQPDGKLLDFESVFPFAPRPLQQQAIDHILQAVAKNPDGPLLVILEAPTGIGKTEVAFYAADRLLQQHGGAGLYVAMPTQATSNQMFQRTQDFLATRYPHTPINIHLVHGNAWWASQMGEFSIIPIGESVQEGVAAAAWFLPRKRTLLAPFGVGTVDQALMSVLQTRHAYLRLFGLTHKVVIFDEVHAYDTYMAKLFQRLLRWLGALGTSVIVLSATLPARTRQDLVTAYLGHQPEGLRSIYPAITVATADGAHTAQLPPPPTRTLTLAWIPRDPDAVIEELRQRLHAGGCAAVICNTVRRAQTLYAALKDAHVVPSDALVLFHARMPVAWRAEIEERVVKAFGPQGNRPKVGIVVATQVIEQSLDLDFDIMITDLAPVDLLIQRAGRLHRHAHIRRPAPVANPALIVARPDGDPTEPDFGGDAYVYERYVLWQTWRALKERTRLRLPSDTIPLIEAVYGDEPTGEEEQAVPEGLVEAYAAMQKKMEEDGTQALTRVVPPPQDRRLLRRSQLELQDAEDPALHPTVRALTRLIEPGIGLVCLHRTPQGLRVEPDGGGPAIDLDHPPNPEAIKALRSHVVTVHHPAIVHHLADKRPSAWEKVAALRYLVPVVFEEGRCRLTDTSYSLHLSREFGLSIEKE